MAIETTVDIKGSPVKLLGIGLLGIGMTALSGAIVTGLIPVAQGSLAQLAGWAGTFLFGAAACVAFYRMMTASGPVVTLSPQGILDRRVSERPVPWSAVHDVLVWSMQGQKVIVLKVDPQIETSVGLTRMARWSRGANARLGADGLCFSASGLQMGHEALLAQVLQRMPQSADAGDNPD